MDIEDNFQTIFINCTEFEYMKVHVKLKFYEQNLAKTNWRESWCRLRSEKRNDECSDPLADIDVQITNPYLLYQSK